MSNETKKIYCNIAQQCVYVRNPEVCNGCVSAKSKKTYKELVEKTTQNGISYELVERDYPITAESVKSYASAASYKNDVVAAMNSPARGKNLGNMTDLQTLLSADVERARAIYSDLKKTIEKAEQANVQNNTTQTEVNNNAE